MVFGLTTLFQNFQIHGYVLIFLLMAIEGPVVTAAAAFAASLGVFNIWVIFILSILGNFIPDITFFFIGRFTRNKSVEHFVERLGLTKVRVQKLEEGFREHTGKTIVFVKLTPFIPIPGILLAGFVKVPVKKFIFISIIFNLTSTILFTALGYYSGLAFGSIAKYFKLGQYALLFLGILIIVSYFIYKKLSKKIVGRLG